MYCEMYYMILAYWRQSNEVRKFLPLLPWNAEAREALSAAANQICNGITGARHELGEPRSFKSLGHPYACVRTACKTRNIFIVTKPRLGFLSCNSLQDSTLAFFHFKFELI